MRRAAAVIAILSLSACSMDPHLPVTPLPVPPSWPAGDPYLLQSEAPLPAFTYRDIFRDPRLQALVVQALANNRDLRIAAANIAAARAQVRITRANQFPELDASSRVTAAGGNAGGGSSGTNLGYTAGLSIPAFELDLFGRLASLTRADQQRLFATEAGARAVRLALVGDIANAWLAYAADMSLLKIAEDTAASAERSVKLTDALRGGGIAPKTDVLQAQQVLQTARQDMAQQRSFRAQDVNLLQLLVGAPVDPANLPRSVEEAAPTIAPLPAGLDSRVLLRRPDVVQAEFELRAANAEIGAARAALFPAISLTGLLGLASSALTGIFRGGAFNWSASANVAYPIFRAGAGRARVAQTQAQRDAALASYEKAIQTAFREVSDALADRGTIADRLNASEANVAASAENLNLVTARYRGGIDPYLTTLVAQRSLYTAQRSRVAVELAEGLNVVGLYRSLGADNLIAQGSVPGMAN
jgi:outer membrane protein, multidrug efflux system